MRHLRRMGSRPATRGRLVVAGLVLIAAAGFVVEAQLGEGAGKIASRKPDDPAIPAPEAITPETDSRLFSESFLVALATRDLDAAYSVFFSPEFPSVSKGAFIAEAERLRAVAGPLEKITIKYLREELEKYNGRDGGWAIYKMTFEKDPQVDVRIDYIRDAERNWKVKSYTLRSVAVYRLEQARAVSREAAGKAAVPAADGPRF